MKRITIIATAEDQDTLIAAVEAAGATEVSATSVNITEPEPQPEPEPPAPFAIPGLDVSEIDASAGTALVTANGPLDNAPNDLMIRVRNLTQAWGDAPDNGRTFNLLGGEQGRLSELSNNCDYEACLFYNGRPSEIDGWVYGPTVSFRLEISG